MSLILFLFFVSDLLDIVDNKVLQALGSSFIDNINILIYSSLIEKNYRVLKEIYHKCTNWAITHSVVFTLEKYKVIYLIRAYKKFNLKAIPILSGLRIDIKDHIRVLGI